MRRRPLDRWKFNRPEREVVDLIWEALELADLTTMVLKPPGLTEDQTGGESGGPSGRRNDRAASESASNSRNQPPRSPTSRAPQSNAGGGRGA